MRKNTNFHEKTRFFRSRFKGAHERLPHLGQLLKTGESRRKPAKTGRISWTDTYLAWSPNLRTWCKKRDMRAPQSKTGKRFFRIFCVQVVFQSGTLRCLREAPTSSRTSYWGFALPLELSLSRGPELGSPTSDLPQFAPPARSEKMKNTPKFGKIRRIPPGPRGVDGNGRKTDGNGRKRTENGRKRTETDGKRSEKYIKSTV